MIRLRGHFISVTQYAKRHNITPQAVRKALKEYRLRGEKIGKMWIIGIREAIKKKAK